MADSIQGTIEDTGFAWHYESRERAMSMWCVVGKKTAPSTEIGELVDPGP